MTNLYDFLRKIQDEALKDRHSKVEISTADFYWLEQYLAGPDVEMHFKARRVGGDDENPIMAQDYAIKGEGVEVFELFTTAMLENPHFANLVLMAANFFKDHVPTCPDCRQALINARENQPTSWKFNPHKPE